MSDNRYYESFEIGETRETAGRTVTEADIVNYAGVSGDFHPLHLDETFAQETDFGERIAHGLLVLSIAAALESPDNEHSFMYGFEGMRFVAPTFMGETISVETELTDKTERSEEHGLITKKFEVTNQDGDTKLVCDKLEIVSRQGAD